MTLPPESRPPESTNADGRPADVHPNYTGPRRSPVEAPSEHSAPIPTHDDEWHAEAGVEQPVDVRPTPPPAAPAQHPSGPFRPHEQLDEGPWSGGFRAPPPVTVMPRQRPVRRSRSIPVRPIAIAVAVVVIVGGLGIWAVSPSDDDSSAEPATTTPTVLPEVAARERLSALLPPGYSDAACEPVATPKGALAKFGCEGNSDPGGPPLATYTLVPDAKALTGAFDDIMRASTVVNCPGSIQSPGPWRRNATPDEVAGTLFCGFQRDLPTVAWTDDENLLVAAIRGDAQGPSLEQLYRWWSSHS